MIIRFHSGHTRILDMLRPHPIAVGMRSYLKARWRNKLRDKRYEIWQPKREGVRGWLPGKLRLAGMRPPRRVIDAAVPYQPITRQYNDIVRYRRRQEAYRFPPLYLWRKFKKKATIKT